MREVFISYKSYNPDLGNNDETVANELCQAIEEAGITCWMAPRDLQYGRDFGDSIVEAIKACRVFLIVFSQHTVKSHYISDEVRIAYEQGKGIIRYKLDDTQLRGNWNLRLGARHWIDATGDYRKRIPELIADLRQKLGKPDPVPSPSIVVPNKVMREVFISYKSQETAPDSIDETVAKELCQAIEAAGITCWMAPRNLPYGRDFDDSIVEAIKACRVFLIVFSQHTVKSHYISDEVRIAYEQGKGIIRYKLDDTQLRGNWNLRLGARHWIDATGDYRKRIPELIADLRQKLGKPDPVPSPSTNVPINDDIISIKMFYANGVSFKMVCVEGGTFTMGATPEQGDDAWIFEKPSHEVTLSTYHIGETLVTQELWQAVMGYNPSLFKGNLQRPVENIFWKDCHVFINNLNKITGKKFRLPTEAEWEFAARGGNRSKGYKYAGSNKLDEVAWYADNTIISKQRDFFIFTKNIRSTFPVATKKPNELGLFDMCGNVWEWCQDWYGNYNDAPQKNPAGPSSGSLRVFRGGGWVSKANNCRVTCRRNYNPDTHWLNCGLRLALDL